jgi:hypothetical protein
LGRGGNAAENAESLDFTLLPACFALATLREFRESGSVPVQTVLIGSNGPTSEQQRNDNMKRLVIAGVAALALTMACQQKASAWGWQISGNIGISLGLDCKCWCDCPCPTCYGGGGGGYGGYAYPAPAYAAPYYAANYAPDAGSALAYQLPAAPQKAAQPQTSTVAAQPSLQPIGYSYGYGNYGYYQVPSYWYGR